MRRRDVLCSVGTAPLLSAISGCAGPTADERRRILGAYPGENAASPERFRPFERWLETRFGVLTLYVNADDDERVRRQFLSGMTEVWQTGHVPMVTWLSYTDSESETASTITRQVRDGEYDDVLEWWVEALAAWLATDDPVIDGPRRLYFRPFPEMNGDWLPWSVLEAGDAEAFVDAWRYVHGRLMDAVDAIGADDPRDRVQWLWNPNATEHGAVHTEASYPGDEYVDWVGIDGYNFGDSPMGDGWQSPDSIFEPMRDRLAALTDRPLSIPEFGTTSSRDGGHDVQAKREWIDDVFDYVEATDVRMACWFNIDKETDWAVFGGARGTETFEDPRDGERYRVYDAFRERVQRGEYVGGSTGRPGVLSDAQFRGEF
ncbi:glycoside hydrolase family 26 protein [Natronorubrum sp. DTA28]|uniref:glycoside hydrolase family 26 protein n=1 Tax=Natronorubrum sp. DTA28 TaxID=3447019 RepID=UPI003F853D4F